MIKLTNKFGEPIDFESFTFPGGEKHVRLLHHPSNEATIAARVNSSDDIMEMLLLTDALRRSGCRTIRLQIPYLPYARQDRVGESNIGESLSVSVMANVINSQNYESVRILDCHSDVGAALINNCTNQSNLDFVEKAIETGKTRNLFDESFVLVSPDQGASKKIQKVAKYINYDMPIITGHKIRNMETGEITGTSIDNPHLVKGRDCLIIDDICDGGRTFTELATVLRDAGANKVILIVTHGIFSKGITVLIEHDIDHIFCTNSFKDIEHPNVSQYKIF